MTTYNIPVESAEKQAVRVNAKGGASALSERGSYLLKPPSSVGAPVAVTITTQTATITGAASTGSTGAYTFTYTATNTFVPGQVVTIAGITTATGFNVSNAVIVTASATQFTISSATNTNTSTPGFSGSSLATPVAIGAATYYYYVTRVSNGVESFSNAVASAVVAGTTASVSFAIVDQTTNALNPVAATSYNLYVGTTVAGATKQVTSGTTTLVWPTYSTTGTKYVDSPAMVAYPWSSGSGTPISATSNTLGTGAYMAPTWVDDVIVHNPNQSTGYSGFNITGEAKQVRQIRTNIFESQIYSRTDTATVKYAAIATGSIATDSTNWTVTATNNFASGDIITISGVTPTTYNGTYTVISSGLTTSVFKIANTATPGTVTVAGTAACGVVADTSIIWSDFGKPVTGTGVPTNAYVGNVTPGTGFVLSSVQGQNVPYYPGTTTAFNATAAGTSITVTGSNLGAIPVQTGQYRTTRWQG